MTTGQYITHTVRLGTSCGLALTALIISIVSIVGLVGGDHDLLAWHGHTEISWPAAVAIGLLSIAVLTLCWKVTRSLTHKR